jgi:ribosome biogenesis GTPase / thiamine phosphate phosphatase
MRVKKREIDADDPSSQYSNVKSDWHRERRENRGDSSRSRQKRSPKGDKENLKPVTIYTRAAAEKEASSIGILAESRSGRFSIASNGTILEGITELPDQRSIIRQLTIGDDVVFTLSPEKIISLKGRLERRSKLVRLRMDATKVSSGDSEEHIIAVNVDIALIVASSTQPRFHPRLIDRYLIMCQYGNVKPVICITKTDLESPPDVSTYTSIGIPTFLVSNETKEGIEAIKSYLHGKSFVLVGNSGVGKSALANSLFGKELLLTGKVGKISGRGTHTTSNTSLHYLDKSTFLIDTPGVKSLELWNVDSGSLSLYFPEFAKFSGECQFRDCSHSHEPKCAVKNAVERGEILKGRYESYIRLLEDLS